MPATASDALAAALAHVERHGLPDRYRPRDEPVVYDGERYAPCVPYDVDGSLGGFPAAFWVLAVGRPDGFIGSQYVVVVTKRTGRAVWSGYGNDEG